VWSCTGYGIVAAVEDQDEDDIRTQFETNVGGLVNIFQTTLPYFREERRAGKYLVFSSMHGMVSVPGLGREFWGRRGDFFLSFSLFFFSPIVIEFSSLNNWRKQPTARLNGR
jgi:NAD(P)-dependent dehydrogenase (short-subunit alcohol dehydrogenase family)